MSDKKRKLPSWLTEDREAEVLTATEHAKHSSDTPASSGDMMTNDATKDDVDASDEDDYLSMTFDDPKAKSSSLISERERLLRERQDRAKQKPKSESKLSAKEGSQAIALQKSLLDRDSAQPPSKALKMMQRMGYTAGTALGTAKTGLVEPLQAAEITARSGLGLDNQKKRELKEAAEAARRQIEEEQTDYRETVRTERDEKRIEGRIHAAQKICETLDTKALEESAAARGDSIPDTTSAPDPLSVNVLWRSLVVHRKEREREKAMRQQMLDAATTFSGRQYNDDDVCNAGDATSTRLRRTVYEEDGEELPDDELEEFESLDAQERLDKILAYLRNQYYYCLWCGCQYTDSTDLENCPGLSEEDHE